MDEGLKIYGAEASVSVKSPMAKMQTSCALRALVAAGCGIRGLDLNLGCGTTCTHGDKNEDDVVLTALLSA